MFGILLIDKPLGLTSHDVVNVVRRKLGTRRVGHAGSLDPLATGALVVAVGPATRFLQYLPLEPKAYIARVQFGVETNTQDAEGEAVARLPVPAHLDDEIARLLPEFLGPIEQIPPMHSAVKKAGRPLYSYARKGEDVEREARTVFIERYDLIGGGGETNGIRTFRIVCSGGTYVRTLAHDLGQRLGCGAHLVGLQRTQVGRFMLEDATPLDTACPDDLIPLDHAIPPMPILYLSESQTHDIREGRAIVGGHEGSERLVALADPSGHVFSVARTIGNLLQPECVIPAEVIESAPL